MSCGEIRFEKGAGTPCGDLLKLKSSHGPDTPRFRERCFVEAAGHERAINAASCLRIDLKRSAIGHI